MKKPNQNLTPKNQEPTNSWLAVLPPLVVFLGRRSMGNRLVLMGGGLGKELTLVNVGKHTTLCDSDMAKEFVQLFIVADGKL